MEQNKSAVNVLSNATNASLDLLDSLSDIASQVQKRIYCDQDLTTTSVYEAKTTITDLLPALSHSILVAEYELEPCREMILLANVDHPPRDSFGSSFPIHHDIPIAGGKELVDLFYMIKKGYFEAEIPWSTIFLGQEIGFDQYNYSAVFLAQLTNELHRLRFNTRASLEREFARTKLYLNRAEITNHSVMPIDIDRNAVTEVEQELEDFQFVPKGKDAFQIRAFGESGLIGNVKGFRQIWSLVRAAHQGVSVFELTGVEEEKIDTKSSRQEAIDDLYHNDMKVRLEELLRERVEAEKLGDRIVIEELNQEAEQINQLLTKDLTPRGIRDINSSVRKKASKGVHGTLATAYKKLRENGLDQTADHLKNSISCENGWFFYRPKGESSRWSTDE
ncbi:hypothetical protein OAF42_03535 [Planctomicrobium sp.]|nr:hypothetical protein [Planctomicrobium sp.]MDB4733495.1 hypothetical protein [Planctomicrobium sp.]